jgi:hypothetical protein
MEIGIVKIGKHQFEAAFQQKGNKTFGITELDNWTSFIDLFETTEHDIELIQQASPPLEFVGVVTDCKPDQRFRCMTFELQKTGPRRQVS